MNKVDDKLDAKKISAILNDKFRIEVFDCVPSTNDIAKELALSGAKSGTTVVANSQTAGRGRRGRSFFSPSDSGVYFSVVLRPDCSGEKSVLVTTKTAVAVAETIDELTGKNTQIKWLNDLYLAGKKCVGILVEAIFTGEGKLDAVIVGIGINLTTASFPSEFSSRAGNIGKVCKNTLVALIVDKLTANENDFTPKHLEKYREKCFIIGSLVSISRGDETFDAIVLGVDDDGKLVVSKDGKEERLYGEEVTLKL